MRKLLERLESTTLAVGPHRLYYFGGSGHPQRAITLTVTDAMVTYVIPPARTVERMRAAMFVPLATKGTQTALAKGWGTAHERTQWTQALAGQMPDPVDPAAYEQIAVTVVPAPGADFRDTRGQDPWYAAEAYGGVMGVDVQGQAGFEITMERAGLAQLKRDPQFAIVKVVEGGAP